MTRLLLIALEFPPIQSAGAFRPLRYVRHLQRFGIQPIVATYDPVQLADGRVHVLNRALEKEIPTDIPIYYLDVAAIEGSKKVRKGGAEAVQERGRCRSVEELVSHVSASHAIDAIWATCPPFNVAKLALLAKAVFKRPLILDMRDAWTQWGSAPFRTWFHYRQILKDELKLMHAADAVVCVTPQLVEMQQRLSRKPAGQFHWIPNAYDFETPPPNEFRIAPSAGRFRVTYAGQFYFNALHEDINGVIPWHRKMPHRWLHYYSTQQRWIYRSPYFFFRAWQCLGRCRPDLADRIEFHYVGQLPKWLPEMAESFGLSRHCTWHGLRSKEGTMNILRESDALLSTSIKVLDGEDYCLASKTFDYLAAGKPILGFVCPGAQRDFLVGSGVSVLFDPDDSNGSARQLAEIMECGVVRPLNTDYVQEYSSIATTRRLAEVVERVSAFRELADD